MNLKPLIFIIASVSFAPSCIDPVDFSKGDDTNSLVVDGMITSEPGPYKVYLSRSSDYNSYYSQTEGVENAIVSISDDLGNLEILTETYIPGIYTTDSEGIQGIPGRQYKLEIETLNGKHYESSHELLSPVPEIDSIYYEREMKQELNYRNMIENYEGFQIYVDLSDPEDAKNYYMWSWTGTHEVHTQPWLYYDIRKRQAAPKDCCATCWKAEHPTAIDVFDDAYLGGTKITKKPVAFIRLINDNNTRHFRGKYHIEVKQLSTTKEAYDYWGAIEDQINSTGSIFEPPPVAITGNITNCDDPDDIVFGYFGASALSTKSIFIPASEAPYPPGDLLDWPDDCRTMGNSTAIMPSFW